jgi:hypothetical protein
MSERVWIVMRGEYNDMKPVAVFASKDTAEEFAKQFDGLRYGEYAWIWTDHDEPLGFPVLTTVPSPVAWWTMYVRLHETGAVSNGEPFKTLEFVDGAYVQEHPVLSIKVLDWATDTDGHRFRHIHAHGPNRDELMAAVNAEIEKIMATLARASSEA